LCVFFVGFFLKSGIFFLFFNYLLIFFFGKINAAKRTPCNGKGVNHYRPGGFGFFFFFLENNTVLLVNTLAAEAYRVSQVDQLLNGLRTLLCKKLQLAVEIHLRHTQQHRNQLPESFLGNGEEQLCMQAMTAMSRQRVE
jgi:hypothetical protein